MKRPALPARTDGGIEEVAAERDNPTDRRSEKTHGFRSAQVPRQEGSPAATCRTTSIRTVPPVSCWVSANASTVPRNAPGTTVSPARSTAASRLGLIHRRDRRQRHSRPRNPERRGSRRIFLVDVYMRPRSSISVIRPRTGISVAGLAADFTQTSSIAASTHSDGIFRRSRCRRRSWSSICGTPPLPRVTFPWKRLSPTASRIWLLRRPSLG